VVAVVLLFLFLLALLALGCCGGTALLGSAAALGAALHWSGSGRGVRCETLAEAWGEAERRGRRGRVGLGYIPALISRVRLTVVRLPGVCMFGVGVWGNADEDVSSGSYSEDDVESIVSYETVVPLREGMTVENFLYGRLPPVRKGRDAAWMRLVAAT
jgi:hypothetical protein